MKTNISQINKIKEYQEIDKRADWLRGATQRLDCLEACLKISEEHFDLDGSNPFLMFIDDRQVDVNERIGDRLGRIKTEITRKCEWLKIFLKHLEGQTQKLETELDKDFGSRIWKWLP